MSLKIRLARAGTKKRPVYHIVIADSRSPRDGRFIERLGYFNPLLPKDKTERLKLDLDKCKAWMAKGALPTDRVLALPGRSRRHDAREAQQSREVGAAQGAQGARRRGRQGRSRSEGRSRCRQGRRGGDLTNAQALVADRICVARIGAAHGLRGEVRLNSFTADPMAVTSLRHPVGCRRHAQLRDRELPARQGRADRALQGHRRPHRRGATVQRRSLRAARPAAGARARRVSITPTWSGFRPSVTMAPRSAPWWRSTTSAPATCWRSRQRAADRRFCCRSPTRWCRRSTLRVVASW